MKNLNHSNTGISGYGEQVIISLGAIKNNADPAQHGRLQIFIPAIDTKDFEVEELPWASYVAPFGGSVADQLVGRENVLIPGVSSYGMWAIPKVGAQVLCGFLEGDPNVRFWMGCFYMPELNRTMPQSINDIKTEIDESGQYPQTEIPHYRKNLDEASLAPKSKHYRTRGGWQRSISHPSNKNKVKPRDDGYWTKPNEPEKADSQIYSMTTPGRHYFAMSDVDEECRIRFKTTEGTQIILDDTNERIYISTAKGRNWVEIDEGSGKIYFYTASKFNIHSENDLNLYSDENINIVAKKRVNIQSEERAVKIQGKMNIELLSTDANVKISASRDLHLKTFDGPVAPEVQELLKCSLPPYSGEPLGLIRDWAEEAGSGSSKIFINAVQDVNVRSDENSIYMTAKNGIEAKAIEASVILQAGEDIEIKADSEIKINSVTGMDIKSDVAVVKISGLVGVELSGLAVITQSDVLTFVTETGLTTLLPGNYMDGGMATAFITGASGIEDNAELAESADKTDDEQIKPNMIVPLHDTEDGWIRDEDEPLCKTPRNKKYQG